MTTMLLSVIILGWILYLLINGDIVAYIQMVKPSATAKATSVTGSTPVTLSGSGNTPANTGSGNTAANTGSGA